MKDEEFEKLENDGGMVGWMTKHGDGGVVAIEKSLSAWFLKLFGPFLIL